VAIRAPIGPGKATARTLVVRAEAPMLMTLFDSRMAPIIVSWSPISRLTRAAALSPSRSSWCMRARLAAVIEVSAAEIRPDRPSRAMRMGARPRRAVSMGVF
jgi:hypothetical protein